MIRVTVNSPPHHPIIVHGDMRTVSIMTEKLLRRRRHDAVVIFTLEVIGQEGEEADADNVREYLADVMCELAADDIITREAMYAEAKQGGPS